MRIEKENIVIGSASIEDAQRLNNWWNDGAVMEHAGFPNGLGETLDQTKDVIQKRSFKHNTLGIIEIDGVPIGEVSYRILGKECEVGFKICNSDYQNKGYGPKIITLLFDYLFEGEVGPIERIVWDTMVENTRAQRVYEGKIGATRLGVKENVWTDQVGRMRSMVEYEMTRASWQKERIE